MQKPPEQLTLSRSDVLDADTTIRTVGIAAVGMTPPFEKIKMPIGPTPVVSDGVSIYYLNKYFISETIKALDLEFQRKSSILAQSIEDELAAIQLEDSTLVLSPLHSVITEIRDVRKLTRRKTAQLHTKIVEAHSFFGGDPFNRDMNEFMKKAFTMEKWPGPHGIAMKAWGKSYRAAHDARLLSQTLESLRKRSINLRHSHRVLQSEVQAVQQVPRCPAQLSLH